MSINADLIKYGGSVLGDPTANPVDTLLAAAAAPSLSAQQIALTPVETITPANLPDTTPVVQPNIVSIAAPQQNNNSMLGLLVVIGVGAALVAGSGRAVGKKKKNEGLALLAIGAGAYYLYTKNKQSTAPVTVAPIAVSTSNTGGTDTVQPAPGVAVLTDPTGITTTAPGPLGTGPTLTSQPIM